jgi:hypothetical protein
MYFAGFADRAQCESFTSETLLLLIMNFIIDALEKL